MLNSGSQLAFQQGTFYIASHFLLSNLLCKSVVAPGSDLKTYLFLDAVADPDTQLGGHIICLIQIFGMGDQFNLFDGGGSMEGGQSL